MQLASVAGRPTGEQGSHDSPASILPSPQRSTGTLEAAEDEGMEGREEMPAEEEGGVEEERGVEEDCGAEDEEGDTAEDCAAADEDC